MPISYSIYPFIDLVVCNCKSYFFTFVISVCSIENLMIFIFMNHLWITLLVLLTTIEHPFYFFVFVSPRIIIGKFQFLPETFINNSLLYLQTEFSVTFFLCDAHDNIFRMVLCQEWSTNNGSFLLSRF